MISSGDPDLAVHRQVYAFYYERATPLEASAMDALCFVHISLTLALNAPREDLPTALAAGLECTCRLLEDQFMDVVTVIRENPTYRLLTDARRAAMNAGCLAIQFEPTTR